MTTDAAHLDTSKCEPEEFDLHAFFPYQTRVFYKHVSEAVACVYGTEYGMKPYEWRTLAILGAANVYTPAELVEQSSMDKVAVSRAIASLSKRGWILSRSNKNDGRSRLLRSSAKGREVLKKLIPMIRQVEDDLLAGLTEAERLELRRLMGKVVQKS